MLHLVSVPVSACVNLVNITFECLLRKAMEMDCPLYVVEIWLVGLIDDRDGRINEVY